MSMLGRLMGKVTGTVKQAERGDHGAHGTGDRNVGGRVGGTAAPSAPVPPELPLDDDGTDARNLGG
jgi:hypothetical protein